MDWNSGRADTTRSWQLPAPSALMVSSNCLASPDSNRVSKIRRPRLRRPFSTACALSLAAPKGLPKYSWKYQETSVRSLSSKVMGKSIAGAVEGALVCPMDQLNLPRIRQVLNFQNGGQRLTPRVDVRARCSNGAPRGVETKGLGDRTIAPRVPAAHYTILNEP